VQAGQVVGIKVLDHIIIGLRRPEYLRPFTSIRELGLAEFDA
jgi:hypothetical protein